MENTNRPTPERIIEALVAYQQTDALRAAIEVGLFTALGLGKRTVPEIAAHCRTSERGIRILSDYMVVQELLTKSDSSYALTPESATFLDRASEAYLGDSARFLGRGAIRDGFAMLSEAVRTGGTAVSQEGTLSTENGVWVDFARGMAPLMSPTAEALAEMIVGESVPARVLDIAAGHGLFGLAVARRAPQAQIVAQDWPNVLEVASENAAAAGLADRFATIPGSAFDVELGEGYDLVLLTNILHHFDRRQCVALMRKVHAALRPGGRAVSLEYVPAEDRVSPPKSAGFALVMLATTPAGDAYTFGEYQEMFGEAGFTANRLHDLPDSLHQVIVSTR